MPKKCPLSSTPFPSQAWLEYAWLRLRRMDYWNSAHIPTNAPAKVYRWVAPGAQVGAKLNKYDEKVGTSPFSVRYYNRDREFRSPPLQQLIYPMPRSTA